jgi:hypothetical protein
VANNPIYKRNNEFRVHVREVIPSLSQLEGNPFDRPVYHYVQPNGVQGIFKKGMNPKAQNILADLLGK